MALTEIAESPTETIETILESPEERIVFRDSSGIPLVTPREWQTAFIELVLPRDQWDKVHLWRNDVPLPVMLQHLAGQPRIVALWPLSGPGRYTLRVRVGQQQRTEDHIERIVTLLPSKITQAAFGQMLADLEERLPAMIALGLQRCGGLAGIEIIPPNENTQNTELLRLRHAVQGETDLATGMAPEGEVPSGNGMGAHNMGGSRLGLVHLLPLIAQDPHHVLQTTEPWVRREDARRPHPARLAHALAQGNNLAADHGPERLFDTRVQHTVDVYENRLLLAFVHEVNLRLRRLHHVTGNAAIRAECETLLNALMLSRRRASFLSDVTLPQFLPTQPTMVLMKRPAYRSMLQGYLRLHRSVAIRLEEPTLNAPLENLPSLYQTWGTLEVIAALLSVASELGYQVRNSKLVHRDATGFFVRVLPDGRPALVLTHPTQGTVIRLTPERTFGKQGAIRSISFEQRPDITVEVVPPGMPPQLYLFDPKYKLDSEGGTADGGAKTGYPKKADIDKMHAYRDAIRLGDGSRVVRYAAILYPGQEERFGDHIEALTAVPGQGEVLQSALARVFQQALPSS